MQATYFLDLNKNSYTRAVLPADYSKELLTPLHMRIHNAQRDTHSAVIDQRLFKIGILTNQADQANATPCIGRSIPRIDLPRRNLPPLSRRESIVSALIAFRCTSRASVISTLPIRQIESSLLGDLRVDEHHGYGENLTNAARVVNIHARVRKWHWTSRSCLKDSISLYLFLRRYGIKPQIVFGVRDEPVGAHCWVELDGYSLSDEGETLQNFSPIYSF